MFRLGSMALELARVRCVAEELVGYTMISYGAEGILVRDYFCAYICQVCCREVSDVAKGCHQHISLNKSLIIASMLMVWQNSYSYRSFRDQQRAANCKCPLQGKSPRTPVHLRLEAEDGSSPALSRRPTGRSPVSALDRVRTQQSVKGTARRRACRCCGCGQTSDDGSTARTCAARS